MPGWKKGRAPDTRTKCAHLARASVAVDIPVDKFSVMITSGGGVNMAGVVATTVARPEWVRPSRYGRGRESLHACAHTQSPPFLTMVRPPASRKA